MYVCMYVCIKVRSLRTPLRRELGARACVECQRLCSDERASALTHAQEGERGREERREEEREREREERRERESARAC